VGKSGLIRTQMGMHNRSENGRNAWDSLHDTIAKQWPVTSTLQSLLQWHVQDAGGNGNCIYQGGYPCTHKEVLRNTLTINTSVGVITSADTRSCFLHYGGAKLVNAFRHGDKVA
jgi:hypothetical protein